MNNFIQKILVLIVGIVSFVYSFEVNTHQALTRCAITSSCGNGYAQNLYSFVNHGEIRNQSYGSEKFKDYGNKTYVQYAQKGMGFDDWNIRITNPNYIGMIEAGSVLEDALYPVHDNDGDGRFNNHFYAAQFDSKYECPLTLYMKTSKTLCVGYGMRTDNIDWVFNKNVNLGHKRVNDYGLVDAFDYFSKSFIGSSKDRRKYQAKLFVSLGHMVHMLQDLHSPAHCRDNSHADGDYLEIYGRYDGGFNLKNGAFNPKNNYWIKDGIKKRGSSSSLFKDNFFFGYEDFFRYEAMWIGYNFASESHFNYKLDSIKEQTSGLSINNYFDNASLFDGRNTHPSKSETFEKKVDKYTNWAYIYTEGNTISNFIRGVIPNNFSQVGLVEHGILFDRYHMIAPEYKSIKGKLQKTGLNQKPLEATAVNVMPRAVAATQAFIDYFFRGQMDVSINSQGKVTIKNVSDASRIGIDTLAIFKAGGKFEFYYRDGNENKRFYRWYLTHDIDIGKSVTIDINKKLYEKISRGTKITVLFDGDIGVNLYEYNTYRIGTRGLSVDVVDLPYIAPDKKPEPNPDPEPEPEPDNATYTYRVDVVNPSQYLPNLHGQYSNLSYDVNIYKNGVLQRKERITNLLSISWWNGSAHFGDSTKHHFDLWCTGSSGLCKYLKSYVPTDTNKPYPNMSIDWTIWNFGIEKNNITLFLYNIRTQIGRYYALTKRRSKFARSRNIDTLDDEQDDVLESLDVAKEEKMQYNGKAESDMIITIDGKIIDSDDSQSIEEDMNQ